MSHPSPGGKTLLSERSYASELALGDDVAAGLGTHVKTVRLVLLLTGDLVAP
ncbi:hypothetical protein [Nonomuraea sp. bgisy101]|uniref:hypothetical protein n=1 Tax=Nonomuraea sp. bgisy101 TaxID=3413784 RepID=UPI003D73998C